MKYAGQVREEIFSLKPLKGKYMKEFAYGILLMGKKFDEECVAISTENIETSKLYGFAISDLIESRPAFSQQKGKNGTYLYNCCLADKDEITKLLEILAPFKEGLSEEQIPHFLQGAFMACGSVADPEKAYHMEFLPPEGEGERVLTDVLTGLGYPPKILERRGQNVLYFKESGQIEDILTIMGAVRSSLTLMETKIIKDLRNRANRATNCETANIDKLVKASQGQKEDILYLMERGKFDTLPQNLRDTATLRLNNPHLSLSQLSEVSGISRSSINYRLDKICKTAAKLREEGEE